MKNQILRASAAAFAAGLLAAGVGCAGGSDIGADDAPAAPSGYRCGKGTYLDRAVCQCLPRPDQKTAPAAAPLKSVKP